MTSELLRAAADLADLLARENDALRRLDLQGAAAMFGAKRHALDAFTAAQRGGEALSGPAAPPVRALAERLATLAGENRALLERAVAVQGRVLGTLARAARPAVSRYGASGGPAVDQRRPALALSARA